MSIVRLTTALFSVGSLIVATPGQARLSDFDRSYNQSGCHIIARAMQLTAINYLTGVPVKDVLPRTRRSLDETKVPFDLKQIAMKKSGDLLGEMLPLKSRVKTSAQALKMAENIANYNLKACLDLIARS